MFELGYRGAAEPNQGRPEKEEKGAMVNCPEANQLASLLPSVQQCALSVLLHRACTALRAPHCTGVGKRFIIMIMAYIL